MIAKRDALIDLFDRARVNGVAYLLVIANLGSATRVEMADITGEDEDTLGKYLSRMESRGLCVRVRDGKTDRWHLTPTTAAILQLRAAESLLPDGVAPKISVCSSSSSSDQISDQFESDQISDRSEEDGSDREFRAWLCRHYGFTGDKASAVIESKSITPEFVVSWMCQVSTMRQSKFKFNKSPEAYALHCILNPKHYDPPEDAIHMMRTEIGFFRQQFQTHMSANNLPEDGEDTESDRVFSEWQIKANSARAEVKRLDDALTHASFEQRPQLLKQRADAQSNYLEISRTMP